MDELQYQNDLLRVQNRHLENRIRLYESSMSTSSNGFLFYFLKEDRIITSGGWDRIFPGLKLDSWKSIRNLTDLMDRSCRDSFIAFLTSDEAGKDNDVMECTMEGGRRILNCEFHLFLSEEGEPWVRSIVFRDTTAATESKKELERLAYYDPLTGLYNRNRFLINLENWLDQAREENTTVTVANININDFRRINDGIGVMTGDELLTEFGRYLGGLLDDEYYMCAHINADMYCLALYDPMGERSMEMLSRRIRADLTEKPFNLSGEPLYITVRMGVAEFPEAGDTALELFQRAEIVMFKVAHGEENWVRYFDSSTINEFVKNAHIEQQLKAADFDKELILYYQPQYNARTGALRGAESLIRWKDASGRLIPPGTFIPVAENSSLIVDIGEWVLERAIKDLASWQKKYGTHITVSVNISALHFAQSGFEDSVLDRLDKYGVSPQSLELEITETLLVENFDAITAKLRTLRSFGIEAALDDFGTGYSSFSYLRTLPLKVIKIDKSFIDAMLESDRGNIIVGSIVDMVNRLGYETVAEGVEEYDQYDFLKEVGCTYIQGYLLGRPMPPNEFEALLDDQVWE